MTAFSLAFVFVNAAMLLVLPRRWAPLAFLVGTCYMTLGQVIKIGPFHFTVLRLLVAAGLLRVLTRGERLGKGMNGLDWSMVVWAVWAVASSAFHKDPSAALTFRLGLVYDACGVYFLLRIFCQTVQDVVGLCQATVVLLIPVAIEMFYEHLTLHNLFSVLGGVPDVPQIREGKIRAFGPFMHPILAGTVGAVCLPLAAGLWQLHRRVAIVGILACFGIVFASSSSGPIMSALAGIGALLMWHYRDRMFHFRLLAVIGYIVLDLLMIDPAYFILARIDLTGGSTGWHRAELIRSALDHITEWWLAGTDYTRHWMPTGVSWSPDHTDITNHYLHMGVVGGLPLVLLFIAILAKGFSFVGQTMQHGGEISSRSRFMTWAVGAALFSHTVTFISVSYFDQSFVFLYLTLAMIGSVTPNAVTAIDREREPTNKKYRAQTV